MGKPQRCIELLEPEMQNLFDLDIAFFDSSTVGVDRYSLAIAYGMQGEIEKRDQALSLAEAKINESLANGLWPTLAARHLVVIAAIRGDAELTAERLALAIDSGADIYSNDVYYYKAFEMVRDDPAVKRQLDRLRAREDAVRDRLYAEGIWQK
jgi:hypothetical protein